MLISFSISLSFPFIFHREFMSLFGWEYVPFIDLDASFGPFNSVANAASSSVCGTYLTVIYHHLVSYAIILFMHSYITVLQSMHNPMTSTQLQSIHSSLMLFIYIAVLQCK
eukprot:335772_1